ncbi:insulinase family protein [Pseudomonas sp. N40(2020)]|uniref:M16 family metallopeptidase n=1 Tax=Pseudomonas sp. N40(2020) TaxID=2767798 RepID=UPI00165719C8|nr:pitrilysin family protein [Pseudomonas sp. N40(2020)]MBC8997677.1 insulinase family protein [Pseudomonas sp. N40(2020)]
MNNGLRKARGVLLGLGIVAGLTGVQTLADTVTVAPANYPAPRLQSLLGPVPVAGTARALSIKGWKTLTGTKVLFIRTTELPMFDLHVSFAAGSARDGDTPGLAAATFSMLNEGIPGKDLSAIVEVFDGLGAQLDMNIDHDRATLALRSLSDEQKRAPALQLFSQILGAPTLTDDALKRVKIELRDSLTSAAQDAGNSPVHLVKTLLAPDGPYSLPFYGTDQGLQALTGTEVKDFHQRFYSASQAQITLVGDLTLAQAKAISLQISNALPVMPAGTAVMPMPGHKPVGTERTLHEEQPLTQINLILAQPSVSRSHADYAALYTANLIFGGTINSRLMSELREKRGLVYDVYSENAPWATAGLLTISLQVNPAFSQATLALTRSLFSDYLRDGPTQQELDQVKLQVANRSALNSSSNWQILKQLVTINRHDLPLDLDYTVQQVQRLTLKQIHEALNRHLAADRWRVVTVGATVEQQALPAPAPTPPGTSSQSMCRAEAGFVAS